MKAVGGKSEPSALSLNGRSFHRRRNDCGDALRHPRTLRVGERPRGRRGRFGRRKTRSDAGAEGARVLAEATARGGMRSEEHTSELQSLMRISYAVFCLKKQNAHNTAILLTNTPT